jgi:hypothetical protein
METRALPRLSSGNMGMNMGIWYTSYVNLTCWQTGAGKDVDRSICGRKVYHITAPKEAESSARARILWEGE